MFEKLQVYQKAIDLADEVASLTENFPRGYYFLTDQLNRASLSIAANIAEGNGRFTKADRKNFFTIARGSVQECVPLLELARRLWLRSAAAALLPFLMACPRVLEKSGVPSEETIRASFGDLFPEKCLVKGD